MGPPTSARRLDDPREGPDCSRSRAPEESSYARPATRVSRQIPPEKPGMNVGEGAG